MTEPGWQGGRLWLREYKCITFRLRTNEYSAVEVYIAIIVACMPAFASFMKTYVGESAYYIRNRFHSVEIRSLHTPPEHKKTDLKLEV
jgi:hypothetical protein